MRPTTLTRVSSFDYEIDEEDRVRAVTEAWLAFAQENQARWLTRGAVLRQPIWHFISGVSTRHLYELMFAEVRSAGRRFTLPMRCDSPDRRRFMELDIEPRTGGAIALRCRLLREEARETQPLLDPAAERSAEELRACSFCKRLQGRDGLWREVEDAILHGDLLGERLLPRLTHVVCPECTTCVRDALRPQG